MKILLLLLDDDLFSQKELEIPVFAIIIMLLVSFSLIWYWNKRNFKINPDFAKTNEFPTLNRDVLGFEKNGNDTVYEQKSFSLPKKFFALLLILVFFSVPVYQLYVTMMY